MYIICENNNGTKTYRELSTDDYNQWIQTNPNWRDNIQYVFDVKNDIISIHDNDTAIFANHCEDYNLSESDLHRQFLSTAGYTNGHICELIKIKPRNRKYPCIILDTVTNKTYKVTARYLHTMFENNI